MSSIEEAKVPSSKKMMMLVNPTTTVTVKSTLRTGRRLMAHHPHHRGRSSFFSTTSTPPASSLLHYEWIHPAITEPQQQQQQRSPIVFLHGLLGHGRNLRTLARRVCQAKQAPGLVVDIPGHGRSAQAAAAGVVQPRLLPVSRPTFSAPCGKRCEELDDGGQPYAAVTLVGHSLGGRLSLYWASQFAAQQQQQHAGRNDAAGDDNDGPLLRPDRVWLLDTVPGTPDASVVRVLQSAKNVLQESAASSSIATRQDLVDRLVQQDQHSEATAQWLAAQYQVRHGRFAFDVETAEALMHDFGRHDFWAQLQAVLTTTPIPVHVVQGGRNAAWDSSLPQLQEFVRQNRGVVRHHLLPDAGHWVHTDDLAGLLREVESVEDW